MNKKFAISGEYLIQVEDTGSISVYRFYDNVKGSLREIAESKDFKYDPNWTTRQFGNKICKEYGNGEFAKIGNYVVVVMEDGSIKTYRTYDNTKGALREIAEKIGFSYDAGWTTRQFGNKLIDAINK